MRWERLFEDLEAQLDASSLRDLDAEVADRTRRERALTGLHSRLVVAAEGRREVRVRVAGVGLVAGAVARVGADWVLLEPGAGPDGRTGGLPVASESGSGELLLPFAAVRAVTGIAGLGGGRENAGLGSSLGLGSLLRAVSRDRVTVDVVDIEGQVTAGTLDVVGQDFVDVAEHPVDLPRRRENVVAVRTVPFAALALVRRR